MENSPLISENSGYEKSKFTDEQIIGFLKQADAGMSVKFTDYDILEWVVKSIKIPTIYIIKVTLRLFETKLQ